MYPTFQPGAGLDHGIVSGTRAGEGAEAVREAAVGERQSGLAVAAAGWRGRVSKAGRAGCTGLWSCAMDAAGIPHAALHPAGVWIKGRC